MKVNAADADGCALLTGSRLSEWPFVARTLFYVT